jgi:hypothetical protein
MAPTPVFPNQAQPSKSFLRVSSPYHVPLGPLGAKHSQFQPFPPCTARRKSNESSESFPSPSSRHRAARVRVSKRAFPIHDDSGTELDVVLFTGKTKRYVGLYRSPLASPDDHTSNEDDNPIFGSQAQIYHTYPADTTDPQDQQLHSPINFRSSPARAPPTSHDQTISVDPRGSDNSDARSLNDDATRPTMERSKDETKNKPLEEIGMEHRPTTRQGNCLKVSPQVPVVSEGSLKPSDTQSGYLENFSTIIYKVDSLSHVIQR